MTSKTSRLPHLDYLRVFACTAIVLHHLNLLPGGFLAVAIFFTLSGYLSYASALKHTNFSIRHFYKTRFTRLYPPLLITILIGIILSDTFHISEVLSILFSCNNLWQASAAITSPDLLVNSPFLHLWYISILVQFDLVFPFLFLALRRLAQHKPRLPLILLGPASLASLLTLLYGSFADYFFLNYMNSFSWLFPWLLGLTFAHWQQHATREPASKIAHFVPYACLALITILLIFCPKDSLGFAIGIPLTALFTIGFISLGHLIKPLSAPRKSLIALSRRTYEIYLLHYPLISFFFHL